MSDTYYSPVAAIGQMPPEQQTYTVHPGDTLYSIAWAFGLDFRELVEINHLKPPYLVSTGQRLRLAPSEKEIVSHRKGEEPEVTITVLPESSKVKGEKGVSSKSSSSWSYRTIASWVKPAAGKVANNFSKNYGDGSKGIEIYGSRGEPIRASAPGKVVYSGEGVRGYGKMIIIKHNDAYLSAYAFNQKLLVKIGESVKQGEQIATMGQDERGRSLLYFEIRRFGKPVDPMKYLH